MTIRSLCKTVAVLLAVSSAAACGSSDSSGPSAGASSFQGLYDITAWTENPSACDTEGPSVMASQTEKMLIVKEINFMQMFMFAGACSDKSNCEQLASAWVFSTLANFAVIMETRSSDLEWNGVMKISDLKAPADGKCHADILSGHLVSDGAGKVVVEARHAPAVYEKKADGTCDLDAAPTAGLACQRYVRITGKSHQD